jgi:RNA polymerase sigma-70 factor (ECF subfamily)
LLEGAIAAGKADEYSRESAPGEWMLRDETIGSVAEGLSRLDAQDRQLLLLKYTEGWGYHELADHLGISIKTVEYRLLKARRALRARVQTP